MNICLKCGKSHNLNHCLDCYEETFGALNVFLERMIDENFDSLINRDEVVCSQNPRKYNVAYAKAYYARNIEKIKKYRKAKSGTKIEYFQEYYQQNKEKLLERAKLYNQIKSKNKRKNRNEKTT
jgi:hypothetical protein